MKALIFWMLPVVLFGLLCCSIQAGSFYDGYHEDGYTYRGQYWWKNNIAYTREKYYTGEYEYNYGYRYKLYKYRYTQVYNATPAYVQPKIEVPYIQYPQYQQGWKEIVAKNDGLREDHIAYLASARQRGYAGLIFDPFGAAYHGASYYSSSYNPGYVPQGTTQYGYSRYSYNSDKVNYGTSTYMGPTAVDLNAIYLQASQLAKSSIDSGQLGSQQFAQLAGQAGEINARLLEIQVRADAAMKLWKSTEPQASTRESTSGNGTTVGPQQPMNKVDDQEVDGTVDARRTPRGANAFVTQIGMPLCGKCHSTDNSKGPQSGLDIRKWATFTDEQKDFIIERLYHPDQAKRMPPGKTLTPAQKKAFKIN